MRRFGLILLALTVVFLAACQKKQSTAEAAPEASPWKMTLATNPEKPYEEDETVFVASLNDPSGQPVSGAEVKAELKMPSMDMGKNEFRLAEKGAGVYEGKGKFTMPGPWDVVVTAKHGEKSGRQTFQMVAHRK